MKHIVLGVLVILLFLPLAQATQISDLSLTRNGDPLQHVGSQASVFALQVNVEVTIALTDNHEVTSLQGNVFELNPDPATSINPSGTINFECEQIDDQTAKCIFINLPIKPQGAAVTIPLVLKVQNDTDSATINDEQELTLSVDNTNPTVLELSTDRCFAGSCYIASGRPTGIIVNLQDSVGTFEDRNIFYRVGTGQARRVDECTGSTCIGQYFVESCDSGDETILQLAFASGLPSSDDVGNPIQGAATRSLICDEYRPAEMHFENQERGIEVRIPYPDVRTYGENYKQGDFVTVKAILTEDVSGITAKGNFSNLSGNINDDRTVTCEPEAGENYSCTWTNVGPLKDAGDATIYFKFTDGAGHAITHQETIFVNAFDTNGTTNTPVFFEDVQATLGATQGYSRLALSVAEQNGMRYPVFAEFELQERSNQDIKLLRSEIDTSECYLAADREELPPSLSDLATNQFGQVIIPASRGLTLAVEEQLIIDDKNRITIDFLYDVDQLPSEFDVVCNVSSIVQEDEFIYPQPTKFEVSIPMKLRDSSLGTPGEAFVEKIEKREKSVDKFWNFIGQANRVAATLADICTLDRFLGNTKLAATGTKGASLILQQIPATSGVGAQGVAASNKVLSTADKYNGPQVLIKNEESKLRQLIGEACQQVACPVEQKWQGQGDDFFLGGDAIGDFVSVDESGLTGIGQDAVRDTFSNINVPNPQESIISAFRSKCFGAVLYHLNQYRQISCNELACMKHFSQLGLDIASCSEIKAQMSCQAVVGEFYDLTPAVRQSKNIGDNVNALAQSLVPKTLQYVAQNYVCEGVVESRKAAGGTGVLDIVFYGLCEVPKAIGEQMHAVNKNTVTNTNFRYQPGIDVCEFAKCNEENWQDCPGVAPSYISGLYIFGGSGVPGSTIPLRVDQMTTSDVLVLSSAADTGDQEAIRQLQQLFPEEDFSDGNRASALSNVNQRMNDLNERAKANRAVTKDGRVYLTLNDLGQLDYSATSSAALFNAIDKTSRESAKLDPNQWRDDPLNQEYVLLLEEIRNNQDTVSNAQEIINDLERQIAETNDFDQKLALEGLVIEQELRKSVAEQELQGLESTAGTYTDSQIKDKSLIDNAHNSQTDAIREYNRELVEYNREVEDRIVEAQQRIDEIPGQISQLQEQITLGDCVSDCQAEREAVTELEAEIERASEFKAELEFAKNQIQNEEGQIDSSKTKRFKTLRQQQEAAQQIQNTVGEVSNRLVALAIQSGYLNKLTTENMFGDFGEEISDFVEGTISSDALKENTCNALWVNQQIMMGHKVQLFNVKVTFAVQYYHLLLNALIMLMKMETLPTYIH